MKIFVAALAAITVVSLTPFIHAQDDAKRTAAAEELIKAMHATDLVDLQKSGIKKNILSRLPKNLPPDVAKQIQDKIDSGLDDILKDYNWDSVKTEFIHLYSQTFTESELKQLTEFYKSPIGQKYIEKRSEVEGGALAIMQKHVEEYAPKIGQLIRETLQAAQASMHPAAPSAPSGSSAPQP
jgi:hypothetical protein